MSTHDKFIGKVLRRASFVLVALASALSFSLTVPAKAAQLSTPATPRIVEQIDDSRLVTLKGNTRPEARPENDRGTVSPDLPLGDLTLLLRRSPEQQAAFDAFLASQQDQSSPNYHHWLTPDQIGEKFGPAQSDVEAVSRWLQNQGLSVTNISKDRLFIRFGGTAAQVQKAFHTEIHNLEVKVQGATEQHIANMSDPKIPEALSPVVVGVAALHNFFPRPQHKMGSLVRRNSSTGKWERISQPEAAAGKATPAFAGGTKTITLPQFGTGGGTPANLEDVTPYDFAAIYNVLPLWNASTPIDGTGQTIAIAATSNINLNDVVTFRSAFNLPVVGSKYPTYKAPKVIVTNSDPGDCPTAAASCINDLYENTLDVEWSGAIAKNAQIVLVTSAAVTSSTDPLLLSEQYIVDNVTANIMNVSYGECELGLGTQNAVYNALWSKAQMEGIAVFVASGDQGSAVCDAGGDSGGVPYGAQFGLSVSGLASTPYDTAVGGTDLNWDANQAKYWATSNDSNSASALGYIQETPWNDTCTNSVFVASVNSQLKTNLTAAQVCDEIGTGQITSSGGSLLGLVDTVGGSGGKSACIDGDGTKLSSCTKGYTKPSWQAGVTGIPPDGARDVPDVSFFASNGFFGSAYIVCVSVGGSCSYTAGTEPTGEEIGGTSVGSPIMAAVMALINQKTAYPQGNPNVELYKLAATETYSGCSTEAIPLTGSSCIFNDIDTDTNAMPCDVGTLDCQSGGTTYGELSGYSSTVGFDLATGLGSMNVANLVAAYATAVAPVASLSPTSLTFASTLVGTSDPTQTVTLKNTGTDPLTISGITITGTNATSFTETNSCGASLAGAASCTITVKFTPTAAGALSAAVSVADNASGSPQTVALSGGGTVPSPIVSPSPTSLTFPSTTVGVADTAQTITVTNTGSAPLVITSVAVTGTNASSYSEADTCQTGAVAVSATCTITVTFKPTTFGTLTGSISITDNATGSPQTVGLTGTAVEAGAFTLSASAVTLTAGATGTSTITATGTGGYSGTINLTCALTTSPTGATKLPTCTPGSAITIASGNTTATGTVTINSTIPSVKLAKQEQVNSTGRWAGGGAIAIAGLLLLGIPARRRNWRRMLPLLLFVAGLGVLSGCGGGHKKTGTTAGSYTFTVTGTDTASVKTTTTISVTVN